MVKRVLMIAFHFPPLRGSSGILRTLKFCRYLPEFGWEPIILTVHPRAYPSTGDDHRKDIANQAAVHRAFGLDASRHLSCMGHYPALLALPDRWASWTLGALPMGLHLIRKYRPAVIWSTYPIATAHLIGLGLERMSGLPWVADFRDPMTDVDYPPDPVTRRVFRWIEKEAVRKCNRAILTTAGAIADHRRRFPEVPASRFHLIENGYDEDNFLEAEAHPATRSDDGSRLVLVHSGIVYPSERDPTQLFAALAMLIRQGSLGHGDLHVILRATAHDEYLRPLIERYGIDDIVSLAPPLPYREALSEMLSADGLLILQAANCNNQIPAKLYEYLRTRRPILALTDPAGNTATALRNAGIDTIAPLDSRDAIMQEISRFVALIRANDAPIASVDSVLAASRRSRTRELGALLDDVSSTT